MDYPTQWSWQPCGILSIHLHFTFEETGAQRDWVTCPESQSCQAWIVGSALSQACRRLSQVPNHSAFSWTRKAGTWKTKFSKKIQLNPKKYSLDLFRQPSSLHLTPYLDSPSTLLSQVMVLNSPKADANHIPFRSSSGLLWRCPRFLVPMTSQNTNMQATEPAHL